MRQVHPQPPSIRTRPRCAELLTHHRPGAIDDERTSPDYVAGEDDELRIRADSSGIPLPSDWPEDWRGQSSCDSWLRLHASFVDPDTTMRVAETLATQDERLLWNEVTPVSPCRREVARAPTGSGQGGEPRSYENAHRPRFPQEHLAALLPCTPSSGPKVRTVVAVAG